MEKTPPESQNLEDEMPQSSNLSEVLIDVWRQALADRSNFVKIGGHRYAVTILKAKNLRQVQFEFDGKAIIGIEQNSNTTSRWAEMARSGIMVMQFIIEGRYAANVAGGKVTLYGKRVSEQKE